MGKPDSAIIAYLRQPDVAADAVNFKLFEGKQYLSEKDLAEADPVEITLPFGQSGKTDPQKRSRDVLKTVWKPGNSKTVLMLAGLEGQKNVHFAMPVRNALYDSINLADQVSVRTAAHRKSADLDSKEFLSGFARDDFLFPVFTLTVLFSTEPWDGPRSLMDMYQDQFPEEFSDVLRKALQLDLLLIVPAELSEEDLLLFHSSLREVLACFKYSKSGTSLADFITRHGRKEVLNRQTIQLLDICLGTELFSETRKENITMTQALQEIFDSGERAGMQKAQSKDARGFVNELRKAGFSMDQILNILRNVPIPEDVIHEVSQDFLS